MALPADWLKVTLQLATQQKQAFYNVFYYKPTAAPAYTSDPMADAVTAGTAAHTMLTNSITNVLTLNTIVKGVHVELTKTNQPYVVDVLSTVVGAINSDELPDWNAVCIQKRTATAGKSGRGRWFLGPVCETFTDEDHITAGFLPDANSVANDWLQSLVFLGATWTAQLFSKKNNTLLDLTTTYVDRRLASINGRKSHSLL